MPEEQKPAPLSADRPVDEPDRAAYWQKNQKLIGVLLAIWALVSFGFAILFPMSFPIGKLPAGFWWAQQGSMYVFVVLIFVYAWRMDALDREYDLHEEEESKVAAGEREENA